ncbi:hypothetical protein TWF730_007892 [Orbilia blumenaviensis]|uniref:Fungal N-terminal domain-containing protein n=1 Tax=Orbilia blumenaviensis TaxID=1796055 RepID=A0AAV9V9D8_9PEZI
MDIISSGVESSFLHVAIPVTFAITRLYNLKKRALFAQSALEDLIREVSDTQRQISSLGDFLERAEFSRDLHHQCDHFIQDLRVKANKLKNLTDCIEMKIMQRGFFRRSRHRLSLLSSDLMDFQRHVEKMNRTIETIRQEMMLEILINSRNERRNQNRHFAAQLHKVSNKLTGNDAKQIRKIYSVIGLDLMDSWSFPVSKPVSGQHREQPQRGENEKIQLVATAEIPEVLAASSLTSVYIDFSIPGSTDLVEDLKQALGKILGRPASGQFTVPEIPPIAELPA